MPRGKRSVRLQSLRENQEGTAKLPLHMDFVRASRKLKPRKWIKKPKVFAADFGSPFSVPTWQPLDQPNPTPALLAIKDRPPPAIKKSLKRKRHEFLSAYYNHNPNSNSLKTTAPDDTQPAAEPSHANDTPLPQPSLDDILTTRGAPITATKLSESTDSPMPPAPLSFAPSLQDTPSL